MSLSVLMLVFVVIIFLLLLVVYQVEQSSFLKKIEVGIIVVSYIAYIIKQINKNFKIN